MATDILTLEEVVAGYGKMTILHGTTCSVARGAITTVIGPNGAGKSTMFKTVFGMLPARSGRILFEGAEITNLAPRDLLARGISYVPQGRNIFPELSVRHNLELGAVMAPAGFDLAAAWRLRWRASRCCAARPTASLHALGRRTEDAGDRALSPARAEADADR